MEQDNSHFRTQDGIEQAKTFPSEHISPVTITIEVSEQVAELARLRADKNQEEYRKRRRDAGILQVTERDMTALSFIGQHYCLTFDHLQTLLALHSPIIGIDRLSVGATRNALERWLQLGYIEPPRKVLRGYPVCVWLSRKGLKDLQIPYAYYLPNPTSIPHFYAVNAIRLHFHQFDTPMQWRAQRLLNKETTHRPLPDAELQMPYHSTTAIQVVESITSEAILSHEINTLLQLASHQNNNQFVYPHLWYFVHQSVLTPFGQALTALDPQVQERVVLNEIDRYDITTDISKKMVDKMVVKMRAGTSEVVRKL